MAHPAPPRPTRAIAFVGNPGTGKSTILNGFVGEPLFSAGLSMGVGRTTCLQEHIIDNMRYIDTPGLNDIENRKQAGRELDQLLRDDVSLKLVFVVTLTNGRVRPEDATTINLVLDAISAVDTNDKFGVVINQVSKKVISKIRSDPALEMLIRNQISGTRRTSFWCYVPHDELLAEEENKSLSTPGLNRLFLTLPETKPVGTVVKNIETSSFEEKLEREVKIMEEKEKRLKEELETSQEMIRQQKLTTDRLGAEVQETCKEMEKKDQEANMRLKNIMDERNAQINQMKSAENEARNMREEIDNLKESAEKQKLEAEVKERERCANEAKRKATELEQLVERLKAERLKEQADMKRHLEGVEQKFDSLKKAHESNASKGPLEDLGKIAVGVAQAVAPFIPLFL